MGRIEDPLFGLLSTKRTNQIGTNCISQKGKGTSTQEGRTIFDQKTHALQVILLFLPSLKCTLLEFS